MLNMDGYLALSIIQPFLIRMIRHTANFVKKSLIHLGCLPRQISCHLKASTISIEQEIDCNRDYLEQKPGNTDLYDVIVGIRNHVTTIITGILSVLGGYKQATETSQFTNPSKNNHVFWITKAGRCRAYGYFDKETKNFYIGVGSLISIIDDSDYIASSSYRNRHRLIDKYGVNIGNYVKIKKDVKCRTAVAAARYTLGAMVNLDLWKDSQGKTLYEVYPDYFFR